MNATHCPPDDRLRAFDRGDVSDAALDDIAAHLGRCEACVRRMATIAQQVPPILSDSAPEPDDSAYRRAVAHAAGEPPPVAPTRQPAVGDTLRDYLLTEKIGHGGMGAVFKAVHTKLDKTVAVKVLSGKRWHDPAAVARFEREMRAVGRLSHPHIVQATDADDADGVPFLVMEYVVGENLSAFVRRLGPRPLEEAGELVRQAAAGLAHAHAAGIVHRDVKPSNLIRGTDGTVKVLDLGLALLLAADASGSETLAGDSTDASAHDSDLTSASHTVGTIDYMPPEQKRDAHAVDERADVYGLGCTFWFLLTGKPPRPGEVPSAGGLPIAFWKRFLAADPDERFPTVEAAVAEMNRRLAPRSRRARRAMQVGAATVVLLAAGVTAFALTRPPNTPATVPPPVPPPVAAAAPPKPGELPLDPAAARQLQIDWAVHLKRKAREANTLDMPLVLVPPGQLDLAKGARVVVSKPYLIGATEVTRGQFAAFAQAEGYKTDAEVRGNGERVVYVINPDGKSGGTRSYRDPKYTWREPGYGNAADTDPVTQVSWTDAVAFCDWLSKKEGRTYRLPTEAEWVWAARAGDPADELPDTPRGPLLPWQLIATGPMRPDPVGQSPANPWGLHDTTGNVAEWCRDWWGAIPVGTHTDYENVVVSPAGLRVLKGRSFVDPVFQYDWRHAYRPSGARTTNGFRVVCELP